MSAIFIQLPYNICKGMTRLIPEYSTLLAPLSIFVHKLHYVH